MDPAYLHALMHGEISFKKKPAGSSEKTASQSKLEKDLDREIDSFVESLVFEEDPSHQSLESPQIKRQKIKLELKEAAKMPELFNPVNNAIEVIFSEGQNYLSPDDFNTLVVELAVSTDHLSNAGLKETANSDLQTVGKISDTSIKALEGIAIAKFEQERYEDSLSLFCLLSILVPGYSEYWFRMGIAAQRCENLDLATKAYAITLDLDPENIGAMLFAAQCFIEKSLIDDAKAELALAKERLRSGGVDKVWLEFLRAIEATLTA